MTTFALTNPPLATSSPKVVASPAFTAYTPVPLTSAAVVDGSPSATFSFTVTGRNFLTAAAMTAGLPVLGTPLLVAHSALSAASMVAGSPVFATATFSQPGNLGLVSLTSGSPVIATPALNQTQTLQVAGLVVGPGQFSAIALGLPGAKTLTAAALTTSSPAFGVSWFVNYRFPTPRTTLVPGSIVTQTAWRVGELPIGEVSETIGQPPIAAAAVAAGAPVFGGAVLLSSGNLAASGLATGSPTLGVPFPINLLSGASLTSGSPVPGAPSFSSLHLFASGLAPTSPVLGSAGLNAVGVTLTAIPLTVGVGGAGFMGLLFMASGTALQAGIGVPAPTLGNGLTASSLTPSAPVLGVPGPMVPLYHFTASLAFTTASPVLGAPAPVQFASPLIGGKPSLGAPSIHAVSNLTASSVSTQAPVLAAGFFNYLIAAALSAGSPVIGSPAPGKILSAVGLPGNTPTLGAPQLIALVASSLTAGHPVLGVPAPIGEPGFPISITTASPVFGTPTLIQTIAAGLTTSSPVLAAPALAPISHLTGAPLAPAPVISAPTLESIDKLVAVSLQGAQIAIGPATLGQRQPLAAASITTSVPEIARPTLFLSASPTASALTSGSPSLDAPAIGQVANLVAIGLVETVQFSSAVMGGHQLLLPPPPGLVTGPPEIGVGDFTQVYPPGTKFITLITPPRVIVVTYVYPWTIEAAA